MTESGFRRGQRIPGWHAGAKNPDANKQVGSQYHEEIVSGAAQEGAQGIPEGIQGINVERGLRFDCGYLSVQAAIDGLGVANAHVRSAILFPPDSITARTIDVCCLTACHSAGSCFWLGARQSALSLCGAVTSDYRLDCVEQEGTPPRPPCIRRTVVCKPRSTIAW